MSNKNVEAVLIGLICMAQKELPYQTATSFQDKAEDLIRRVLKEFPLPSPPSEDFPDMRDQFAMAADGFDDEAQRSWLSKVTGIPEPRPDASERERQEFYIACDAWRKYKAADAMMKAREVKHD